MSQVIKVSPSTAVTSESNNSIDENNRNDTDSERGATTLGPSLRKKAKIAISGTFNLHFHMQEERIIQKVILKKY